MSAIGGFLSYFGNAGNFKFYENCRENPVYNPPKRKMKPRKRGK